MKITIYYEDKYDRTEIEVPDMPFRLLPVASVVDHHLLDDLTAVPLLFPLSAAGAGEDDGKQQNEAYKADAKSVFHGGVPPTIQKPV